MTALLNIWNQAASMDESDIPEDELADLDPAAYERVLARKAHKKEEDAATASDRHDLKVKAEERERRDAAEREAMIVRAEQWDHATTDYGGLHISQAEAQNVRQYIVDHRADTVAYGLGTGAFRTEAEGQQFVDREARLHALNEADRAGALSADGQQERAGLEQQQQPYSAVRSHFWEIRPGSRMMSPQAASGTPPAPAPAASTNDDFSFRSRAPDLKGSFAMQAGVPEPPPNQPVPAVASPVPVRAAPLAMAGLS